MPIPKIQNAFNGWESPITMIKVTQSIVDMETITVKEDYSLNNYYEYHLVKNYE